MDTRQRRFAAIVCLSVSAVTLHAQQSRLSGAIDGGPRVTLAGHVPLRIRTATDRGAVAAAMPLPSLMLVLKPTAAQQTALATLLQQQQDPSSPNYHQWLTPDQYADQFGVSQSDIGQIETWLQSQGFSIWRTATQPQLDRFQRHGGAGAERISDRDPRVSAQRRHPLRQRHRSVGARHAGAAGPGHPRAQRFSSPAAAAHAHHGR